MDIINSYKEFLREMEYDFQIIVINQKLDVDAYIHSMTNLSKLQLYHEYLEDMRFKLEKENIYQTYYYIVVTMKNENHDEMTQLKTLLLKLEKIGLKVRIIDKKTQYLEILYNLINKENIKRSEYE